MPLLGSGFIGLVHFFLLMISHGLYVRAYFESYLILVSFVAFLNMSVDIYLASFSIYVKGGERVLENVISVALAVYYYSTLAIFSSCCSWASMQTFCLHELRII